MSARQAQDSVQIAILHQDFKDLAGFAFEKAIVGRTRAARPPGFNDVNTCWTKFSCLLLVSMVKSSRSGAWFAPLVPNGGLVRMTSYRSPGRVRKWCRRDKYGVRRRAGKDSSARAGAARDEVLATVCF